MRNAKYVGVISLILLPLALGVAQSRDSLRAKYGEPSYEIRPGVWMSAKFGEDGQMCEAVIKEQNNCRAGSTFAKAGTGVEELLYELAPEAKRGKFLGRSEFASDCCGGYKDEYENVAVLFADEMQLQGAKSHSVLTIRWKGRKCKLSD